MRRISLELSGTICCAAKENDHLNGRNTRCFLSKSTQVTGLVAYMDPIIYVAAGDALTLFLHCKSSLSQDEII